MKKFFQLNPRRKQLVLMALVGLFVLGSFGMGGFALAQQNSSSGSQSQQEFADGGAAAQLAETTPSAAVAEKTSGNWITSWIDSFLSKGVSLLVFAVVGILGVLMELLTWALIVFAQYNGFVKADAVNLGWTLVRDVANMFFVVVLLAIALGTILRIENYNFKKMLPKLLIMAVLVNFSLVIAGIMIDAAQVVMLTFVAAFDEAIGSNIFKTLHITDILTATTQDFQATEGVDFDNVVMNGMLAILFLFIALCVVFVIACMLLVRIVALWILLVLAPMPYILYAFPFTRKYAEQWWSEFVKYLIVGPALAFFLWLAFAVIGNADNLLTTTNAPLDIPNLQPENQAAFIAVAQPAKFLNYIVGIAMLFAGLIVTQKLGVVGGSMAGSVVNKAKSLGTGLLKGTGKWGLRRADDLQARALKGTIGAVG